MEHLEHAAGDRTAPDAARREQGVTALAAYLESVGRVAAEAAARGEILLAQALLTQAARVASTLASPPIAASTSTAASKHAEENDR